MSNTLDFFQEVTSTLAGDLLHIKRGTGVHTDKKITIDNLRDAILGFLSKTIIVENPTSSEDLSYFFTDTELNVSKIRPILVGSATPSVTWTLRFGPDRSAAGTEIVIGGSTTTDTTTGSDITVLDNAVIPADSHVWLETTAKSGTVNSISLTLFYSK